MLISFPNSSLTIYASLFAKSDLSKRNSKSTQTQQYRTSSVWCPISIKILHICKGAIYWKKVDDSFQVWLNIFKLMPCPSAWTKYFLSGTKSDLSKTNWFFPWKIFFCPGQKFCPWLQTSFLKAKMIFKLWTKFLSWTKNILSLTKLFCLGQIWFCPGQKIFCPGRWTGH